MSVVYLDASALVKLVVREPESVALMEFLREHPDRVSSALALAEVPRALRRARFGAAERRRAREVLARVALVDIDRRALAAAAAIEPPTVRTLDAIHLAAAQTLPALRAVVTYDIRMQAAAQSLGLPIEAPSPEG